MKKDILKKDSVDKNWKEKAEEWRKKAEIFFIMKENSAEKHKHQKAEKQRL